MSQMTTVIATANALSLVLGRSITWFAFRAFRRTRLRALGGLPLGNGRVTLGMAIGGFLHHLTDTLLLSSLAIRNTCVSPGLTVLAGSLALKRPRR